MAGLRDRLRTFWDMVTTPPPAPGGGRTAAPGGGPRVAGPPPSPNGASSFHLIWDLPRTPQATRLVEVSATLEILEPPQVPSLYFWALQVDFAGGDGRMWGGGHTGLQWNRQFPQATAANWGGYASQDLGGAVLPGTLPDLFSLPGDPNTMAYAWTPGHPYRFTVRRSPGVEGGWRSSVTDLESGESTMLRDLMQPAARGRAIGRGGEAGAGYLFRPVVWSEVFADCDAPSVIVRWSDLTGYSEDGSPVKPRAVTVNYQSHQAGGCANTTVRRDETGLLQITNAVRDLGQGARLDLGGV